MKDEISESNKIHFAVMALGASKPFKYFVYITFNYSFYAFLPEIYRAACM